MSAANPLERYQTARGQWDTDEALQAEILAQCPDAKTYYVSHLHPTRLTEAVSEMKCCDFEVLAITHTSADIRNGDDWAGESVTVIFRKRGQK